MSGRRIVALALALAALLPATLSCRNRAPELVVLELRNGARPGSGSPFLYENLDQPLLRRLADEEGLAAVVAAGRTEWGCLVLLREWSSRQWLTTSRGAAPEPYPNALTILERIRSGDLPGGSCSEYSVVLMQASLALGYQARLLSIESEAGAGHRVVEVWSNEFQRWAVMDPLWDLHYERDGRPLGALDLHRALVAGDFRGITVKTGTPEKQRPALESLLENYYHLTVIMRNNHLSLPDPVINRFSLGWVDAFTKGRPRFSVARSGLEEDLYWPLNQTWIEITGQDATRGVLELHLSTKTPNFRSFEARITGDPNWHPIAAIGSWRPREGEDELHVRAVDVRGISGPSASLRVRYRH